MKGEAWVETQSDMEEWPGVGITQRHRYFYNRVPGGFWGWMPLRNTTPGRTQLRHSVDAPCCNTSIQTIHNKTKTISVARQSLLSEVKHQGQELRIQKCTQLS